MGRFDNIPANVIIELKNGEYIAIGDAADVESKAVRDFLLDYLPEEQENAKTEAEITDEMARRDLGSRGTFQRVFREIEDEGLVHRERGLGRGGRAFGYWRSHSLPNLEEEMISE